MRHMLVVIILAAIPFEARAQVIETGATLAQGCAGSDGSVCGNGKAAMVGVHASWWIDDRFEIAGRFASVGQPDQQGTTTFPIEVTTRVSDRSRSFYSGVFTYHFMRGATLRPMVGVGSGIYRRSERVECAPVQCAAIPGTSEERGNLVDVILLAGASVHVTPRWVVRGGVITHRFANDENSTTELFAGIGYRFGAR